MYCFVMRSVAMRKLGCLIIRDKLLEIRDFDLFSHGISWIFRFLLQNRKAHSQLNSILLPILPSLLYQTSAASSTATCNLTCCDIN